jgi:hypothetical protein
MLLGLLCVWCDCVLAFRRTTMGVIYDSSSAFKRSRTTWRRDHDMTSTVINLFLITSWVVKTSLSGPPFKSHQSHPEPSSSSSSFSIPTAF